MLHFTLFVCVAALFTAKTAFAKSSYTYCYNYTECEDHNISTTFAECYGYYGCEDARITSKYTLAWGELGCYDADIESSYTYGYGHNGVYGADIETANMYVYGYEGARVADIEPYSDELNVYFYGYYAGYSADVSCYSGDTCKLYCGSSYGCYDIDFYCYSGATCYYDCSGDDTCPTLYSGVSSDVSYVTRLGDSSSNSQTGMKNADFLQVYADLEDEEITFFKKENQQTKDKSKSKIAHDLKKEVSSLVHNTLEAQFWAEKARAAEKKQAERREDHPTFEMDPASVEMFKQYKYNQKLGVNENAFAFGVSLKEYGVALLADVCILAIMVQTYKYCTKQKYNAI